MKNKNKALIEEIKQLKQKNKELEFSNKMNWEKFGESLEREKEKQIVINYLENKITLMIEDRNNELMSDGILLYSGSPEEE